MTDVDRRAFVGMLSGLAGFGLLDFPVQLPGDLPAEDMALQEMLRSIDQSVENDLKREKAPRIPLRDFVAQAWHTVEKKAPYLSNWHVDAISEHLEAITFGELEADLLINIPPGCMKSMLVSVMWPAWEWTIDDTHRYLCGSYDEQLSIRDNRNMRDIITSAWYQERWPVQLRKDQNAKTRFDNLRGGWRLGTSVGGRGTGLHPTRKIIDDPHNVKQSRSDVQRKKANSWLGGTMSTRGTALNARTIVIMQRLHEDDLSGHILNDPDMREQFVHICLPMRYEPPAFVDIDGEKVLKPRMPETPLGFQDLRTEKGELLWPELWSEPKVAKAEAGLRSESGEFGVSGQMAQRPVPESGGIFKREWFVIVDAVPSDAQVVGRCRGWDAAGTEDGGDYTAGVRMAATRDGRYYVEHVYRGQIGPGDDEAVMKQIADMDGFGVRQREEQEPGSAGKKVIRSHAIKLAGHDYRGEPSTGDKVTRARPLAAQAAVGNVFIVRGDWNRDYLDEMCLFPNGRNDDQVDGTSTAFNELALAPQNTVTKVKLTGT